ncbi:hypothetical protein SMGD1_2877 [Sulfurimonas gotlandica GD1]|jgi:hypothetical protein|uniref:Uncharacterized protein n=1 Tax=Sulfurimonas gotlandica (strain DSM 19862 / JCM 16533 / GD1) TaxID=929558 RepID=H1FUQ5_SULGG|nr:hypothetical protein [Sulfurimonas gotlandica]EHP31399.1 hypothetical protein SMGD1_2877 [Sulfurimonas gotlandica GD1]
MVNENIIGKVHISVGDVRIVDVEGNLRNVSSQDILYDGEQIYSNDADALFQVNYLGLEEISTYSGAFRILADDSVVSSLDGNDNIFKNDIDFNNSLDLSNLDYLSINEAIELGSESTILDGITISDVITTIEDIEIPYAYTQTVVGSVVSNDLTYYSCDEGLLIDIPQIIDDIVT